MNKILIYVHLKDPSVNVQQVFLMLDVTSHTSKNKAWLVYKVQTSFSSSR
jgi:hypothetical protein